MSRVYLGNQLIDNNLRIGANQMASMQSRGLDDATILFVSASGITSSIQINAVDYLVKGLKSNNLWNKMEVVFPIVGNNQQNITPNLIDPFREQIVAKLAPTGSVTITNGNGITTPGTGQNFFETYYYTTSSGGVPYPLPTSSIRDIEQNQHFSFYSRTTTSQNGYAWGSEAGIADAFLGIKNTSNGFITVIGSDGTPGEVIQLTYTGSAEGFYQTTATTGSGQTVVRAYRNSDKLGTSTGAPYSSGRVINITRRPTIGASVNSAAAGSTDYFQMNVANQCAINCAYWSAGFYLNDSEATKHYEIVQEFQTRLGRQV